MWNPTGGCGPVISPRRSGPLCFILVVAAALRAPGLAYGLRHLPEQAERIFILNVWGMVESRSLDPHNFLYPGFFFYLLYPVVALVHRAGLHLREAYLGCRILVAAFSVVNVVMAYLFASRLGGRRVGLLSASILAVSPLEIETAHFLRPDVVLETVSIIALLAFRRVGKNVWGDVRAGLLIGAATAIKFTGVLVATTYVGYRLLAPPRVRRLALAALVSILLFVALSPYTVLSPDRFTAGAREQLAFHYQEPHAVLGHWGLVLFYARAFVDEVGPVGALLAAWTALRRVVDWRSWGPLLAFPAVALSVYCSARVGGARFLLPMGGLFALLAALGLEDLLSRSRAVGILASVLALLVPLGTSFRFVRNIAAPSTLDRTLDWLEAHAPAGSRIMTTEKHLGLDRSRFKITWPETNFWLGEAPTEKDKTLAWSMDFVVANPKDLTVQGFPEVFRAVPETLQAGFELGLYAPPPRGVIPPEQLTFGASENPDLLDALRRGDGSSYWHTEGPEGPGAWIQVTFPSPHRLERIELEGKNSLGGALLLEAREADQEWKSIPAVGVDDPEGSPPTQVLLIEPRCLDTIRISPLTVSRFRWNLGAIRIVDLSEEACPSSPGAPTGLAPPGIRR
jgi:hypothetical protein